MTDMTGPWYIHAARARHVFNPTTRHIRHAPSANAQHDA